VNEQFRFSPWPHQVAALKALDAGKNAVLVWHRKAGKDLTIFNFCIAQAYKKPGTYYYLFPTYAQGKKIMWDGMDADGVPYREYIPDSIRMKDEENETEMQLVIRTHNGRKSIIQIVGTDNVNRIVGPNPIGAIHSEYSLHNPRAKALLDPIFLANKGWQAFAYTPRGKNHGWDLYDYAVKHPDKWYASILTIKDTTRLDGSPIVVERDLDELRAQGQDEDLIQQEYYCSFEGSVQGSYYGHYLSMARNENRIGFFPWTSGVSVRTAWDIGKNDTNVVWFYQKIGQAIRLIDYYEDFGGGAEIYSKVVMEKPYTYEGHSLPWDADMETAAAPKCFRAQLQSLGLRNCRVVRKCAIETGISAVRRLFPRLQFNEATTEEGLKALAFYHKEWDEDKQTFKNHPDHDWSSNAADSMRTLAMGESEWTVSKVQTHYSTAYDPFKTVPETYETESDFMYDQRGEMYASDSQAR
jgi:hypothetical protein